MVPTLTLSAIPEVARQLTPIFKIHRYALTDVFKKANVLKQWFNAFKVCEKKI